MLQKAMYGRRCISVANQNTENKVTIIMSNYNQEKYIKRAIESVLSQKVSFKYELLITDDCSKLDHSIEIIKEYERKYDHIKAIYATENGGYLKNIIRAKEQTKTDYFCLLDADDYWTDMHWLQEAFVFLENNKDFVIYEANVACIDENEKYLKPFISPKIKAQEFSVDDYISGKKIPITQTTGMFFRNVIFRHGVPQIMKNAVGTLSERSFEGDTDRLIMHLKYGKARYVKKQVGVYRMTSNGIWAGLSNSSRILINARCYVDYFVYYNVYQEFFVNMAWENLKKYLEEYLWELEHARMQPFNNGESDNFKYVYNFCAKNSKYINKKTGWKQKVSRILKIMKG